MPITNGYCTLSEFKSFITSPGTAISADIPDDSAIESIIESVSRYIDSETSRKFYARTAETRLQSLWDSRTLYLDDDLLSITAGGLLNGDGTAVPTTEYKLLPLNGSPKYAIRMNPGSSYFWETDSDGDPVGAVSVTGSWGYSATAPDDIRLACLNISKGVYNRRYGENQSSDSTITAGGVVITPKDVPALAMRTLNSYRRIV